MNRPNVAEPRNPNLIDILVQPQYQTEEQDKFKEQFISEIQEKIEEFDSADGEFYGLAFEDALNFSNGSLMTRLIEASIDKLNAGGDFVGLAALMKRKERLEQILAARREEISYKMSRVPMLKMVDKFYFICGVTMSWLFAFMLGRYPGDYFITFFTFLIIPLVFWRWIRYLQIGMHYYLIDLCYFSTALILYNVWIDPKNEVLMRIGFLTSNGCLAVSMWAFRNSLVFHDMDCMTSMGIHGAPMLITHQLRWNIIPAEASKPPEERRFASISTDLGTSEYLKMMLLYPHYFYFVWAVCYAFVNFVLAHERIQANNYSTLYRWFVEHKAWLNLVVKLKNIFGENSIPLMFMIGHYVFFIVSHIIAMLEFEYYWLNLFFCIFYMFISMKNGANYYMEFFAKRYEQKLEKIEALAGKSLSMEERQKAAWGE